MSTAHEIANRFFDPTEFIGDQEKFLEVTMKRNELEKAIEEVINNPENEMADFLQEQIDLKNDEIKKLKDELKECC